MSAEILNPLHLFPVLLRHDRYAVTSYDIIRTMKHLYYDVKLLKYFSIIVLNSRLYN